VDREWIFQLMHCAVCSIDHTHQLDAAERQSKKLAIQANEYTSAVPKTHNTTISWGLCVTQPEFCSLLRAETPGSGSTPTIVAFLMYMYTIMYHIWYTPHYAMLYKANAFRLMSVLAAISIILLVVSP